MMLKSVLPVCLNLEKFRILIVGAGIVAAQKLKILQKMKCPITMVSRDASKPIQRLAKKEKIALRLRSFKDSDIKGHNLIYACTDDGKLNRRIARLAKKQKALFNITDNPSLSNFISPAVCRNEKFLVAVSTSGRNPLLAVSMRNRLQGVIRRG